MEHDEDFNPLVITPPEMIHHICDLVGQCFDLRKAYASVSVNSNVCLCYASDIEVTEYPAINDYNICPKGTDSMKIMFADRGSMEDLTKMVDTLKELLK